MDRFYGKLANLGVNGGRQGSQMVNQILKEGLVVEWSDKLGPAGGRGGGLLSPVPAGEPLGMIRLNALDRDFIGGPTRATFNLSGWGNQLPTGRFAGEIVLGHELSHALLDSFDPTVGLRVTVPTSVTFENQIRSSFGVEPRTAYHELNVVNGIWTPGG